MTVEVKKHVPESENVLDFILSDLSQCDLQASALPNANVPNIRIQKLGDRDLILLCDLRLVHPRYSLQK